MIRSAIRTNVRSFIKEASAVFWTDALLNTYINDAQDVYCSRTGLWTKTKTMSTVNAQEGYNLDTDFIPPVGVGVVLPPDYFVKLSGKPLQFLPISVYQMIRGYGTGAALGTTPLFFTYFTQGGTTTSGQTFVILLLPTPAAGGSNDLIAGNPAKAPALSDDTHVPQVPGEDHEALAWQASAFAFLQRGQTEEAAIYQAMFDRRISDRLPGGPPVATAE